MSITQPFSSTEVGPAAAEHAPWRPLEWTRTPVEVARALGMLEGFVWLDSALAGPGARSILTARPQEMLTGQIQSDWGRVTAALEEGGREGTGGGLFGWVGFDGQFVLGVYPHALLYDHDSGKWFERGELAGSCDWTKNVQAANLPSLEFQPRVPREVFLQQVRRAQQYIAAGDIYQVNLSVPWAADWPEGASPLGLYEALRAVSPAPEAAFVNFGETAVLSASPELFLKMSGRTITTRPIKGTRPRFAQDPERDAASARQLVTSEKERAELLMITDLERNDLGQVCEFGSVDVPELWEVEGFAQVYHLVSTVTGRLRPEVSHAEAFRACFPGGSISGAPKKRALQIIDELETHPRGIYTGAIGYFGFDGESQWNIAIRTAVRKSAEITFHVGAGIVADSVPELEWDETLHKAAGVLAASR